MNQTPLLLGIGQPYRSDDHIGCLLAQQLYDQLSPRCPVELQLLTGDGMQLMEYWKDRQHVWIIDAVHSGATPGTIHRFDAIAHPLPASFFTTSTHLWGVAEAVEMARTLRQLPQALVVFGIEGKQFGYGTELSPEVIATIPLVLARATEEILESSSS